MTKAKTLVTNMHLKYYLKPSDNLIRQDYTKNATEKTAEKANYKTF